MEGRESGSPSRVGHGPFGGEGGYRFGYFSSSVIHPTAMRHNTVIPNTNPNLNSVIPNTNPNLNTVIPNTNPNLNADLNATCVVPNLNPNAVPSPSTNSSNSTFFDIDAAASTATPSAPQLALMVNLAERSFSEPAKRKRGRPRKYDRDGNGGTVETPLHKPSVLSSSVTPKKRGPYGKKAQLMALGAAGQNFTPHVLTVATGEDVSTKIITFTSQGPWAVCILSANGAISNATLRHAGVSGGAVTYEGRFEILSLSGSFLLVDNDGTRSRTGGLSVSLAGPDGRVIGGGVAGLLMAASPVQIVVGTFFTMNPKKANGSEATLSGVKPITCGAGGQSSPLAAPDIGVDTIPDRNGAGQEGGQVHSRIHYPMPMQSMEWDANHFEMDTRDDMDARDDTDPATSPGEP